MRVPIIVGNWKMNLTIAQSEMLVQSIHYGLPWPGEVDVVVVPSFTALLKIEQLLKKSYIGIAAQNFLMKENGAYTGEVSISMLSDLCVNYAIIGHSERRQYFNETDEVVNQKVKAAIQHRIIPIICVGETDEEQQLGLTETVISKQVNHALSGLMPEQISSVIIAYEPVWAIGTGKTPGPAQIEKVHAFIRCLICSDAISKLRILYGGSIKPENSQQILSQPNVDGALIGGASLNAVGFTEIIKIAAQCKKQ